MATRTSAGKARTRTSGRATPTASPRRSPAPPRPAARRPAQRRPAQRPPARRRKTGPGWVVRLGRRIGRLFAGLWLGVAHLLGGGVRRLGDGARAGARELDPAHRRDGVGLLLVGAAILTAAGVWWQLQGHVGSIVRSIVEGGLGRLALLAPLLLFAASVRLLRPPAGASPTGRAVIGWAALLLGVTGMVHVVAGTPLATDGA